MWAWWPSPATHWCPIVRAWVGLANVVYTVQIWRIPREKVSVNPNAAYVGCKQGETLQFSMGRNMAVRHAIHDCEAQCKQIGGVSTACTEGRAQA
eukprot:1161550-Pelagomonas_calceolata.AAC.3